MIFHHFRKHSIGKCACGRLYCIYIYTHYMIYDTTYHLYSIHIETYALHIYTEPVANTTGFRHRCGGGSSGLRYSYIFIHMHIRPGTTWDNPERPGTTSLRTCNFDVDTNEEPEAVDCGNPHVAHHARHGWLACM